ncbi:NAD-dependent epimerase [Parachryseolinea silvisoli]|uniref:NAD-dependent epimerase n=1 Tax=Parachryseolinea silvisoli TaxID=2873601 RepID=UPI0022658306|nr:NAD-dependent epimerase [Parachryseolinea silvisoli]MCD9019613.1 NAD-dependent epimerase [Parachryseolinea silvisoli]
MTSQHKVLVTGAAGFIGFHLSQKLIKRGFQVIGIDNVNDYYDVNLKLSRLAILKVLPAFTFIQANLHDQKAIYQIFSEQKPDYVVNLAAQAGVRYSLVNPHAYLESNLHGFLNILEACRHNQVKHLVYASSSSVYGANTKMPFSVHHNVDHPISLYAASKKSNELMAHTYSVLFNLPTTGLRFFTVYGPYGRPDMALFIFTKAIIEGKPIDVYNQGKMRRDFTYVDDIVESISRLTTHIPVPNPEWNGMEPDPATSFAPYRIYNIGNNSPTELLYFIEVIEQKLGKKAIKNLMPIQDGDVPATFADVDDLMRAVDFKPSTPIEEGIGNFIEWYKEYYKISL